MDLSKIADQTWEDLILKDLDLEFEFLALKILLSRLRLKVKTDSTPDAIKNSVEEIKKLFARFENLPSAQKDLQRIIKSEG
ncbi:MAG: hypothetical protein GX085_02440 [Firmicutes bacterium]|jgi:hypothetical protein|nr:hypothetical protein [Bacillota bacterium]